MRFADDRTGHGDVRGVDTSSDLAVLRRRSRARRASSPARARRLRARSRRGSSRWRSASRSGSTADRHRGDRVRHRPPDPGARRLPDRQGHPDRRADQPRQLRRPAARRARPRDRRQLADRDRRRAATGNIGIGFAVPSNTVRDVVPRLEPRRADRARLPRASRPPPTRRRRHVQEVTAGGPAERAGVRAGDVIVSVDGERIRSPTTSRRRSRTAARRDDRDRGAPRWRLQRSRSSARG